MKSYRSARFLPTLLGCALIALACLPAQAGDWVLNITGTVRYLQDVSTDPDYVKPVNRSVKISKTALLAQALEAIEDPVDPDTGIAYKTSDLELIFRAAGASYGEDVLVEGTGIDGSGEVCVVDKKYGATKLIIFQVTSGTFLTDYTNLLSQHLGVITTADDNYYGGAEGTVLGTVRATVKTVRSLNPNYDPATDDVSDRYLTALLLQNYLWAGQFQFSLDTDAGSAIYAGSLSTTKAFVPKLVAPAN